MESWSNQETRTVATYYLDTGELYEAALEVLDQSGGEALAGALREHARECVYKGSASGLAGLRLELAACALERVDWSEVAQAIAETAGGE